MDSRVQTGEKDRIYVQAVDATGAGVTGATITVSIRRQSDGYYWSGTGYTTTYTALTMSQLDSTNLPGVYYYDFTPSGPSANFLLSATTSSTTIANAPWIGEVKAGSWVDYFDDEISSRASSTDMTEVLKRIGATIVELDMRKLHGFMNQIFQAVGRIGR